MTVQIKKWGNSLALRISKDIAENFRLSDGSLVDVISEKNEIIIRPAKPSEKYILTDVLKKITVDNLHSPVEWGASVGKEVW